MLGVRSWSFANILLASQRRAHGFEGMHVGLDAM
jgi:hypothetical protein